MPMAALGSRIAVRECCGELRRQAARGPEAASSGGLLTVRARGAHARRAGRQPRTLAA
jgi:hypothetical protein